ncbi:MAG: cyclic nucleotide-binding domain-containing protein [Pseudomonadota bacterium]
MSEIYEIAIVGSGPAGASAAARAAQLGVSHVLLERTDHLSDTIYKYQRGKYVMATPDNLPLQSDLRFEADTRENILGWWDDGMAEYGVNLRFNAEVTAIEGEKGAFTLRLASGDSVQAKNVVLAIGLQGNLRQLDADSIPGADNGLTEYQLDDPKDYWDKDVVVIGAGDAAIENAVALAQNDNRVTIVNRKREFARAKSGNVSLILNAVKDELLECAYNAAPVRVEDNAIVLKTPEGERVVPADRVIARLGAIAPRQFIEGAGGVFEEGAEFPRVNEIYECDRPGVFIIGALAGYPLIKHCMNQGYEVVHTIVGDPVESIIRQELAKKFTTIPGFTDVQSMLEKIKDAVPLFQGLTLLQLSEFLLDAEIHFRKPGETFMVKDEAGDSLFVIHEGDVEIPVTPEKIFHLSKGAFFGEMGLIMGRRRTATVQAAEGGAGAVCIEIPRTAALKLIASSPVAKRVMDETAILRQLQTFLSPELTRDDLAEVIANAEPKTYSRGEALIKEGDEGDAIYLIRAGSATVSRKIGASDVVMAYVPAGQFVGEMALLFHQTRSATVRATVPVEAVEIDGAHFRSLLGQKPKLRAIVDRVARERAEANQKTGDDEVSRKIEFMTAVGLGEATNAIVIDESLCVRCDYCEKACAESHDGVSRLDRAAGPTYANIHVPISCRHCEQPHCMADCPPNALQRDPDGAVYVNETCIGCGNCVRNCPYDAIKMSALPPPKSGLLSWLLFGGRYGPGEAAKPQKSKENKEAARKCDLCRDAGGEPHCVRACPTGAVIRVGPEELFQRIREGA